MAFPSPPLQARRPWRHTGVRGIRQLKGGAITTISVTAAEHHEGYDRCPQSSADKPFPSHVCWTTRRGVARTAPRGKPRAKKPRWAHTDSPDRREDLPAELSL